MSNISLSSKIISTLGNPSSIVPLGVKDTFDGLGATYISYNAGGIIEGKDRFIDEFGTQAIWLFGLPVFKGLIDKTAYKIAKLNPEVDTRIFKQSKDILDLSIEKAPTKELQKSILDAQKKLPLFKGLFISKVLTATVLTIISYTSLSKFKHHLTKKRLVNQYNENNKINQEKNNLEKADNKQNNKDNNITFKGANLGSVKNLAEKIMFDPVQNMMLVDATITSGRLNNSRNKSEFAEFVLKEGAFWACMYLLSDPLMKGLENISEKVFKKPVNLDIRVLTSKDFKDSLKSGKYLNDLKEFENQKTDYSLMKFLHDNPENIIVKTAKAAEIIPVYKENTGFFNKLLGKKVIDTGKIDTSKFINLDDVRSFAKDIDKYSKKATKAPEGLEKFIKSTQKMKVGTVLTSMGTCCILLGAVVPYLMVKMREKIIGTTQFQVADDVAKELRREKLA